MAQRPRQVYRSLGRRGARDLFMLNAPEMPCGHSGRQYSRLKMHAASMLPTNLLLLVENDLPIILEHICVNNTRDFDSAG